MLEMTDLTVIFRTLKSIDIYIFMLPILLSLFLKKPEEYSADKETGS